MLINILAWVVVGGLAGWVAGLIMKGGGMGTLGNIIVGMVGAVIGGFVLKLLNSKADFTGFNLTSFLVALLGSVILLFILGLLKK